MAPLIEFHASMADVANEQHQKMAGLVLRRLNHDLKRSTFRP
jgi:hypothetical protein